MKKKLFDEDQNIIDVEYSDIMESSYLNYSMSVIVDRAVPDVRDGLKPVQRRILYSMADMGYTSNKPTCKTARVVGDVIGKYHPHGDSSVNEAIVTLSQGFKKLYPLVRGQGNLGSIEGDEAAAPRYTEVKLNEFSEECFLKYLNYDTVDFGSNYDETLKEPNVLPCLVPGVLITGAEGIAVGMATNIPTHNLGEVVDACIYYLDHPNSNLKQIMRRLPAPDFPSGGVICNPEDLESIYTSGVGKIRIRGVFEFEPGKKYDKLIITQVPYPIIGKGINSLLVDIAKLVEDKTLPDVVDILNQTDKDVRIVLEIKKNSNIDYIKNTIFAKTQMECTYGVHMLAIDKGTPKLLGLMEILSIYKDFQFELYTRKFNYTLSKLTFRSNVLEGYLKILDDIENVVQLIKSSENIAEAKQKLSDTYNLNEDQCSAILSMTLSRLVKLGFDEVAKEYEKIQSDICDINSILSDEFLLIKEIVQDLKNLKKKFSENRKTLIDSQEAAVADKIEIPATEVSVLVNELTYIHTTDKKTVDRNIDNVNSQFLFNLSVMDDQRIGFITSSGKLYKVKVSDIPHGNLKFKGEPLENFSNFSRISEKLISIIPVNVNGDIVIVTKNGKVKKVSLSDLNNSRKTTDFITLDDGDKVAYADIVEEDDILKVSVSDGTTHIYPQSDIKTMSRGTKGVIGTRFKNASNEVTEVKLLKPNQVDNKMISSIGRVSK